MILKFKLTLAFLLVVLPAVSSFASTYTKEFERVDGVHKVTISIQEGNSDDLKNAKITASEYVNDKKIWGLVDYINKCPLDINMDLIKGSFEIEKINGSFDSVVFLYDRLRGRPRSCWCKVFCLRKWCEAFSSWRRTDYYV